jgi:subtilisin family serine protease
VTRSHVRRAPARIIAALASAAIVGATVYAAGSPVGAAPAVAAGGKARPVPASKVDLSGRRPAARISAQAGKTQIEPGQSGTNPALPRSGRLGALIELDTSSTLAAYRGAAVHGRTAASAAARTQFARIKAAQARVAGALPAVAPGSRVLYRTHSVLAGIAVSTEVKNLPRLRTIAGVRAVYPIVAKKPSNAYAVPLVGAPQAWTAYGDLGQDSTIAVIDTGIDYTHANFGGPGTAAAYATALAHDAAPADPALFPSAKIIGGTDLAGDDYNADADPSDPSTGNPTPAPDPNPLDCNGHGSHVAGTAAGFGVDAAGSTFAGPYNTGTPFDSLRIGPGMAPQARLYAFKVFGCQGSTNVVGQAIDMAGDPNGDGDPADHADVINMSLGADFGSPDDGDSVATNAAVDLGITVAIASGNAGDYYDIGGAPGGAVKAITAANTVDASSRIDHVHVSAPAGIAGDYGAERSIAYDWAAKPDLSGTLVPLSDPANKDGCSPLSPADAAAVLGKVAFLEWTDDSTVRRCGSAARAGNVATAGAVGFVFADDGETFAAGITGSATIPGVIVIKSAGDAIRAALADGVVVTGTGTSDFRQLITADNDKVNDSSSRGIRLNGNVKPDVGAVGTSVFSTAVGTGSQGESLTGTSMATPMVAGLAALVKSKHPDWMPQDVKADIMNTAGQDLWTGDDHSGVAYAPNRVGAGRIDAKSALDNQVLAYGVDSPGAVSVSFGPVAVTGPTTLTRTVKVTNKGIDAATYDLSYAPATSVPGVSYTVASQQADPSKVTVPGRSSALLTVSFVVTDPTALTKTIDPTMDRAQAGLPRNYLADASGRIVLTPVGATAAGRPGLRVPVYAAPRPASTMTQPGTLTLPAGAVQTVPVPLTGTGVSQGSGQEAVQSIVAGFELQATSGLAPACSRTTVSGCIRLPEERAADVRYVGTTSDALQMTGPGQSPLDGLAYFAVSTQGPWQTQASKQEFDVYIDTSGDNRPDVVLFNTRLAGQDIFVSALLDLASGSVLDLEAINNELGDVDTAEFDSDTLVLPVAISALPGVGTGNSRIHYGVASFSAFSPGPIDLLGLDAAGMLHNPMSFDPLRPAVSVFAGSGVLYRDMPGTALTLRRDTGAYNADHGLGALMVHFHNRVGSKTQVVHLKSAPAVTLRLSTTRVRLGGRVDLRATVANTDDAVPTGRIGINKADGTGLMRGVLTNGAFTARLLSLPRGSYRLLAFYPGDANYTAGASNTVTLVIF